jgi:TusA-related sulfurtransferase
MNRTVNNKTKMMTMSKKMMTMNSNKVVVTMTNNKMMTKMVQVMMTNNNKVQVKTNSSNQSRSRKIKSCLHLKWLSVNNLNSLNLLLYSVKFLTCHVLLIISLGLYILLLSQVCRGGRMEVVMALRISFIKLGWKILKCLSHKDNRALLS